MRKCWLPGESACAETIVKTVVFIRFPLLRELEFWMDRGGFGHHVERFLVPLETLLVIFEGIGSRLEFCWFFRDSLGDPRLRQPTHFRVTSSSRGVAGNQ